MFRALCIGGVAALALAACATTSVAPGRASTTTLIQAETAFAKSMADRDFKAFGTFIDEDAVFINGGRPLRGKSEVLAHWEKFFADAQAPFSWAPVIAEISAGNHLGYTEGPVALPDGKVVATFYTTWQLKDDGSWKVIFDNGYDTCDCAKSP